MQAAARVCTVREGAGQLPVGDYRWAVQLARIPHPVESRKARCRLGTQDYYNSGYRPSVKTHYRNPVIATKRQGVGEAKMGLLPLPQD